MRFPLFLGWTIIVLMGTGSLLVAYTFGDCGDAVECVTLKERAATPILIGGFLIYWVVAILMFRRWSR